MSVATREPRRNIAGLRLSIALVVSAVVVAVVVVWRWEPGANPTNSERSASEPTTVQTARSAEATLAEIAEISDDFSRNAAMYRLADGATREQVEEWLAEVEALPPSPHRYDLARVLYIRFAVIDPEAALDHAFQGATKPAWLEAIFRTWAQLDPDAAVARASILRDSAKAAASRALLQLGMPMEELRSIVARLDATEDHDSYYRQVERIAGLVPPTPTMRLLAEIEASKLGRRNGESHAEAWNRAVTVEGDLVRQILAERIALDWAAENPIDAMAEVKVWASDDRYVTVFADGSGFSTGLTRNRILSRIMGRWSGDEPVAAFTWLLSQETPDIRSHVGTVVSALTQHAPEAAIARLADVPRSQRSRAAGAIIGILAERNIDQAVDFFASLDIESKAANTATLGRHLAANGSAEQALDWAMSVDERIRTDAVTNLIWRTYYNDSPVAAIRLIESIDDSAMRAAAAHEVVWGEVRRDAQEALAWAQDFTPETERPELVTSVFAAWSGRDAEAACGTLFDMRGGPLRDRAAAAMMSNVVGHDIRLAERLFSRIETSDHQAEAARTLHRYFSETDPNGGKAQHYRKYFQSEEGGA